MVTLDDVLKITQIGFYFVAATVATLTYVKAKNGLLNSVNTEYHKRVLDRLAEISAELNAEYDWDSPKHWTRVDPIKEVLDRLHKTCLQYKHEMISTGKAICGIPISTKEVQFRRMATVLKSDPFIPPTLREAFVKFYEERANGLHIALCSEVENYLERLTKGEMWDTLEENHHYLHNPIMERLRAQGCGITEVEEKVHNLRVAIRAYFKQFDPIARKMD